MTSQAFANGNQIESIPKISNGQRWAGRIISGFASLFFAMDGVMKLVKPAIVVKTTVEVMGFPESTIMGIGITLLACTVLYVFPRTSIFGAILLTGYLGGAVASQVRIGAPVFNVIFAAIFGVLVWIGLWFRDVRVREFVR